MENTEWLNYKIQIRDRLRVFTLKILELSEMFPKSERGRIVNNQLTRSGSSMYSNYRAALRGRSKAEFFSKLSITVEEADETEMARLNNFSRNSKISPGAGNARRKPGIIKNTRFHAKTYQQINQSHSIFNQSHINLIQSIFNL